GWFSATDESSGVVYYYTEDGQSSWTRPPATTAAKVEPPSMTHQLDGGDDEHERKAKDLAAARIQAVARGKRYRKINNSVQMKAVAHNEHKEVETGGIGVPNG
ncbi:unnamed protein product, partial [Ectocarpus sp. 12 AP-2014]